MGVSMKSLELKRYGRLPNGVKTELLPFGYTPSSYESLDGGRDKLYCMRSSWISASYETLPVQSILYESNSPIDSEILMSIVTKSMGEFSRHSLLPVNSI